MFRLRRRPGENQLRFNTRSALKNQCWFEKAGRRMAYHRVIKAIYKSAWFGWLLVLVGATRVQRRAEGLQHRQAGHQRTSWEHPFVIVFGPAWRGLRNQEESLAQWMRGCDAFINQICSSWGLPGLPEAVKEKVSLPLTIRLPVAIDEPPQLPTHELEQQWQSMRGRLWVQTDCKAISELLRGSSTLKVDAHAPLFRRIARSILALSHLGLQPLLDFMDLLLWSPRRFNPVADHAANASMDSNISWFRVDGDLLSKEVANSSNLRLCIDGGRRSDTCAALGLALYAATFHPLASMSTDVLPEEASSCRVHRQLS